MNVFAPSLTNAIISQYNIFNMSLQKVVLKPGFNKQATASQAEGEWVDGDNVRFRYQSPEKIGGWV